MSTTSTTALVARSGGFIISPELPSVEAIRAWVRENRPELVGLCIVTPAPALPVAPASSAPVFTDRHFAGRRNAAEEASFGL